MDININLNVTFSPSTEVPPWAVQFLSMVGLVIDQAKDTNMALSKTVQDLVDQVAASTSLQAASAAAMTELVRQSADLSAQVAALTAAGTAMSAEDAAAITKAAADLAASAVALQAAVPANVPVVVPTADTPPV